MKKQFKPLNEYFDKIFVVTLKRSTDRHAELSQRLGGLDYELFYGFDKNKLNIDELIENNIFDKDKADKRFTNGFPIGQLGCSLSHIKIYEKIISEGYENVLILEDDVITDFSKLHLVSEIIKEIPADCNLLYWGFNKNEYFGMKARLKRIYYHLCRVLFLTSKKHMHIRNQYPRPVGGNKYVFKSGTHDCTHAYSVTRKGAQILFDRAFPIHLEIDQYIKAIRQNELNKAYCVIPRVFYQDWQLGQVLFPSNTNC